MVTNSLQFNPRQFSIVERIYLHILDKRIEDARKAIEDSKEKMANFVVEKRIQLDADQRKIDELRNAASETRKRI